MTESAIAIQRVNKRFGDTHAVRDLDLLIPRGSLCGFLGPNGAGKSTTIRMIMSIIRPDSGAIEVLGREALQCKDRIGYLPEERGMYRRMRVGEFLVYIARLKGMPRRGLSAHIRSWLDRVELPDAEHRRCQELSKGMQQKVQFLAAVVHNPELIILDEPFSGLDPVNTSLVNQIIRELHNTGKTIIFSTHVLHQAELICQRIFLINHGVKLLDSTMDEIHRRFDPRTIELEPLAEETPIPRVDGVEHVSRLGRNGTVELHLSERVDPTDVMRAVVALLPVRSIRIRRLSLEEVFIRLVRTQEGEVAASAAREELSHD